MLQLFKCVSHILVLISEYKITKISNITVCDFWRQLSNIYRITAKHSYFPFYGFIRIRVLSILLSTPKMVASLPFFSYWCWFCSIRGSFLHTEGACEAIACYFGIVILVIQVTKRSLRAALWSKKRSIFAYCERAAQKHPIIRLYGFGIVNFPRLSTHHLKKLFIPSYGLLNKHPWQSKV